MISLKDNKLSTKKYGVVYCEEYVREAVLKFENLLNIDLQLLDNDGKRNLGIDYQDLEKIIKIFKEIFGDFEDE